MAQDGGRGNRGDFGALREFLDEPLQQNSDLIDGASHGLAVPASNPDQRLDVLDGRRGGADQLDTNQQIPQGRRFDRQLQGAGGALQWQAEVARVE